MSDFFVGDYVRYKQDPSQGLIVMKVLRPTQEVVLASRDNRNQRRWLVSMEILEHDVVAPVRDSNKDVWVGDYVQVPDMNVDSVHGGMTIKGAGLWEGTVRRVTHWNTEFEQVIVQRPLAAGRKKGFEFTARLDELELVVVDPWEYGQAVCALQEWVG